MKKKSNLQLKLNKRKVSELSANEQAKIQGGYYNGSYLCTQVGNTCWNFTCNSFYCSITGC
ncbi:class I lanthipeptide [Flavobacteriaceae bacterium M23B6Z8]